MSNHNAYPSSQLSRNPSDHARIFSSGLESFLPLQIRSLLMIISRLLSLVFARSLQQTLSPKHGFPRAYPAWKLHCRTCSLRDDLFFLCALHVDCSDFDLSCSAMDHLYHVVFFQTIQWTFADAESSPLLGFRENEARIPRFNEHGKIHTVAPNDVDARSYAGTKEIELGKGCSFATMVREHHMG